MRGTPVSLSSRLLSAILAGVAGLAGCVFVPETTASYDHGCGVVQKHMTLKSYQLNAFVSCHNEGCVELLVVAGAVSATTFVVSGSVAVVGDAVYWLEAKSQCLGK